MNYNNYYYYGNHRHRHYQAQRYYTGFVAPIYYPFLRLGHVVNVLTHRHSRVFVGGLPFFYFSGVFYKNYGSDYIVVSAPIGAVVKTLPAGFIGYSIGPETYYTVNDVYYIWDEPQESYIVVEKPENSDKVIKKVTQGRLIIEPQSGQDEKQQAKDRYTCHRWAVTEANVDPTEENQEISEKENKEYKNAIAACLEDREYIVKAF